ncbi:MAG: type II toxin-antitoxin system VapC family toxin [Methanoregula sp.]
MRFIDANVFIYAVLKPKTALPESLLKSKTAAKEIFLRVNAGEPVTTTTVHLSEVANVLEDAADLGFACDLVSALLSKPSIRVQPVSADTYRESARLAQKYSISINDALALVVMEQQGIDEIYSFDRHFSQAPVRIVQE